MWDDDLYSLFALDPTDLVGAPLALPPIAGGADLRDLWDIFEDIITGAGDFVVKVLKGIKAAWDRIWEWIGGAIKYVWNWLDIAFDWLGGFIRSSFEWLWTFVRDSFSWIYYRLQDAAGWLRDRVDSAARWVVDRVDASARWVRDRLNDSAGWIRDRVDAARDYLWDKVEWAQVWLRDRLLDARDYLWTFIRDSFAWIYDRLQDAKDYLWTLVRDSFDWLYHRVSDAADDLRDWVSKNALWVRDQILPAISGAADFIGDKFGDAIKFIWTGPSELIEAFKGKLAIPGKVIRGHYTSLEQLLEDAIDFPPLIGLGLAAAALVVVMIISYAFQTAMQTYVTPMVLPQLQATQARVGAQLLTVGVIQEALDRRFIDEATAADHLSRMGYSGQAKQALLDLAKQLPSASDLMRMADKRVWALQVPEKYGQYTELPDQVVDYMDQIGYSEDWTRNYWRAHWDLPGPAQVFEMRHRRVIDDADMEAYLGLTAWLPFFRDKLLAISYNPVTRVDLRRLFKGGIITEEAVFDGYRDLGYNDEKARYLTDYTKKYYSPDDKSQVDDMADLAVTTFRTAYRRHVITRDEALDRIVEAGYAEDVADFLLSIDDAQLALNPTTDAGVSVRDLTVPIIRTAYAEKLWDRARAQQELEFLGYLPWEADLLLQLEDLATERELTDLEEAVVKEQYLANAIDREAAAAQLDTLNVLPERRDLLLQRWDLQRAQKPKRLTLAQLQKAFKADLFTEPEFLDELSVMGYNDRDVQVLLALTAGTETE